MTDLSISKNISFSDYTTIKIGGPVQYLVEVESEMDLLEAVNYARKEGLSYMIVGEGSNLLVSDKGLTGIVIVNRARGIEFSGNRVLVKSGENLWNFINKVIEEGLAGIEAMSGIPGTVGGAIYGNAGAYGQTISDHLVRVKVFDGQNLTWFTKDECEFGYRESIFKNNKFAILEAEFEFMEGSRDELAAKAREIVQTREKKYPVGIKCPGSFFKNVIADSLPPDIKSKIPEEKIVYGKIPAGYLLEEVGAKGQKLGGIEVASYHGNLFVNKGSGTAHDFLKLAKEFQKRVKDKFGIELEPEVQVLGETF